jgi:hypothetical protein
MIQRNRFSFVVFILFVCTLQAASAYALGMAKLTVRVVDEDGHPLVGARVEYIFQSGGLAEDSTYGVTDEKGINNKSGFSSDGSIGGGVDKYGYYTSIFHHDFYVTRFGTWQPWGKELTVVMRPIVNPVPMYEVDKFFKFPLVGEEVGFDLMKADWVIPHGEGTHADFVFKVERIWDDGANYDATMTLTFSNPLDGIQVVKDDGGGDFNAGSRFRLPRTAPKAGYQSQIQKRVSSGTYGRHNDKSYDNNYIFRVRSEVDENGKLKQAMYGKIRGELRFSPGDTSIGMGYYLNPDYTPNLEFDYKRNLFNPVLPIRMFTLSSIRCANKRCVPNETINQYPAIGFNLHFIRATGLGAFNLGKRNNSCC